MRVAVHLCSNWHNQLRGPYKSISINAFEKQYLSVASLYEISAFPMVVLFDNGVPIKCSTTTTPSPNQAASSSAQVKSEAGFIFVPHLLGFLRPVACIIKKIAFYPPLDKCHTRSQIVPVSFADFDRSGVLVS